MTDIAEWRVFGNGGWVKVEKGRVRIYSPTGQLHESIELRGKEVLAASHGGNVVGVVLYADKQPMTLSVVRFDIYDERGERELRLDNPWFNKAIVADDGTAFCGIAGAQGLPESVLRFYNKRGLQQDTLMVKRFKSGRYSRDGSRFIFESGGGVLRVTNADGRVLHELGHAEQWDASRDGRIIAVAHQGSVRFFHDGEGISTMNWPEDREPIRHVSLSPDGRHAIVVSPHDAAVISIDPPEILWELQNNDSQWNYRCGSISENADLIAIGADYDPGSESGERHNKSRCYVYDSEGRLLAQHEREPQSWTAAFPVVRFTDDGSSLIYRDRDGMTRLTIER